MKLVSLMKSNNGFMNSRSRKPLSLRRKVSRNVAGLSPAVHETESKQDILKKFEDDDMEDDIFGVQMTSVDDMVDDFKTIQIPETELSTLKLPFKKSIKFQDQIDHHLNLKPNHRSSLKKAEGLQIYISPTDTISTSSPKSSSVSRQFNHRKTLSDYSENDTDATSEVVEEDFEDIDMIFGKEESGLYKKMNERLTNKKRDLEYGAELEEIELKRKWENSHHQKDETGTLKLKDFKNYNQREKDIELLGQLNRENTIDYDYVKDDYENFEEGFEDFDSNRFKVAKHFEAPRSLNMKNSMPNFVSLRSSQGEKAQGSEQLKKFKSVIELNSGDKANSGAHPVFNDNNKIIRKLDRIPSFYSKEIKDKKERLLSKYREQAYAKKEQETNTLRRYLQPKRKKKVGLIQNLNYHPIEYKNIKMKYNPISKQWEGNEIDLMKFESLQKPALITMNDLNDNDKIKKTASMIYDKENLRWINLEEDYDDVFDNIPDLNDEHLNHSPVRGISTYTQRTTSSASTLTSEGNIENEISLSQKNVDKFLKEESRFKRKTEHWFNKGETYILSDREPVRNDYFWEIRKLVIDTDG
ncbi:uncharacterized protein PRCAT00003226001 [Priceomyces carsonii]|uniref:uncharacterized protein n=1 Tax=Priceomyces carsonii TaxID=28549 RepID=UPI002ED88745|nr:unnamed protein product [Priceomyces carsonii]